MSEKKDGNLDIVYNLIKSEAVTLGIGISIDGSPGKH